MAYDSETELHWQTGEDGEIGLGAHRVLRKKLFNPWKNRVI